MPAAAALLAVALLAAVPEPAQALLSSLPSYIKTCKQDDPKLNECVVRHGRQAIPKFIDGDTKYNVPRLDPLEISELKVQEVGTRRLGIKMSLKNCKLTGLKDASFTAARVDLKGQHIEWDFFHPFISIVGQYEISGRVLILPIRGKGQANITLTNTKSFFKFDFDLVKDDDGEEYMKVRKSRLETDIGHARFRFENLFNGDKLLGESMNAFINAHWKEVVRDVGAPVFESIADVFKIILSRITELVPYRLVYSPPSELDSENLHPEKKH